MARIAALWTLALSALACGAQTPLRYRIEPGDRWIFARSVSTTAPGSTARASLRTEQWTLWCFGGEPDARLVLLERIRLHSNAVSTSDGLFVTVDSLGRATPLPEFERSLGSFEPLLDLLPGLPAALADADHWTTAADMLGRTLDCRRVGPDPARDGALRVDFTRTDPTGVDAARSISHSGSYWFDSNTGRIVKLETRTHDAVAGTTRRAVTRLYRAAREYPRATRSRFDDLTRWRAALRLEQMLRSNLTVNPERVESILKRLDRAWRDYLATPTRDRGSPLRRLARNRRQALARSAALLRQRAALARDWLNRPAADWTLQDLDGSTVTSDEFRGKFLLEVFWTSESTSCLRTLIELQRRADVFASDKPALICINTDTSIDRAHAAARKVAPGLVHVFSGPPVGGDPIALPVLRLLSPQRSTLAIFYSDQPDLFKAIRAAIE